MAGGQAQGRLRARSGATSLAQAAHRPIGAGCPTRPEPSACWLCISATVDHGVSSCVEILSSSARVGSHMKRGRAALQIKMQEEQRKQSPAVISARLVTDIEFGQPRKEATAVNSLSKISNWPR